MWSRIADRNKVCDRLRSSDRDAEDRTMFYLKAGFHMIADRRSQIANRNKVCDRLRSYGNYFCDRLRSCDRDRRRSQKIVNCHMISRRRPYCDFCDHMETSLKCQTTYFCLLISFLFSCWMFFVIYVINFRSFPVSKYAEAEYDYVFSVDGFK